MPDTYFGNIPLDQLAANDYNARRFADNMTPQRQARFNELVNSIREKGIIEPLLVRVVDFHKYEVIAGERRYRAALEVASAAGIDHADYKVPCMVHEVDDDQAFDLMVVENLQREDLTPLEMAQAFRAYLERYGNTAESVAEISARTGIPTHAIRRQVRMLDLPAEVLSAWKDGALSTSHVELLTRIGDRDQVLELLTACLRSKLSVRELTERIGTACPELERGFFDKGDCQVCHYNTSVQSGLFADVSAGGKCGNSACFEAKQSEFLTANWPQSKAAKMFGTKGFRFGHRLANEHREPLMGKEASPRCLECDCFVSVLRLTGAVIGGYDRTCIGPRKCFEELYLNLPKTEPEKVEESQPVTTQVDEKQETPEKTSPPPAAKSTAPAASKSPAGPKASAKPAAPPAETGPVFNSFRGDKYRQAFIKEQLQVMTKEIAPGNPRILSLALLAIVTISLPARKAVDALLGLGVNSDTQLLAKKIFEDMLAEELHEALRLAAVTHLQESNGVSAILRQTVAENSGVHLQNWTITKEYLQELNKSEIVRIGEEPGVRIWRDEKVKAYHQVHHKGKALLSLAKEDLMDLILKSGADLAGRVPAEILGQRKG